MEACHQLVARVALISGRNHPLHLTLTLTLSPHPPSPLDVIRCVCVDVVLVKEQFTPTGEEEELVHVVELTEIHLLLEETIILQNPESAGVGRTPNTNLVLHIFEVVVESVQDKEGRVFAAKAWGSPHASRPVCGAGHQPLVAVTPAGGSDGPVVA